MITWIFKKLFSLLVLAITLALSILVGLWYLLFDIKGLDKDFFETVWESLVDSWNDPVDYVNEGPELVAILYVIVLVSTVVVLVAVVMSELFTQ